VFVLSQLKEVPGVCKILDYFEYSSYFCVVMEYYKGVDLYDYITEKGHLSVEETTTIIRELVETLIELEKKNIYHNDIKDENIVINKDGKITLIDFGAATSDGSTTHVEFSGTRVYAPPEWIVRGSYNPQHATAWALGILLVDMLTGNVPFKTDCDIIRGTYSLPAEVPSSTKNLISKCLNKDPARRPSLEEILHLL
jgi:serine/threonine protein kinase